MTTCIANVQNPGSFVGHPCEREATLIVTDTVGRHAGRQLAMCGRCAQPFIDLPDRYTVEVIGGPSLEERKASITASLRAAGATDAQIASITDTMR